MSIEFNLMCNRYKKHREENLELFNSKDIKFNDLHPEVYNLPDVGTDRFQVASGKQPLATSRAGPCFVLCLKGERDSFTQEKVSKESVRALSHITHIFPIGNVLKSIKDEMEDRGCDRNSIRTYVIGGIEKNNIDEAVEILDMAKENNIVGVCFKPITSKEALDVMFVKNKQDQEIIFATKSKMIKAPKGFEQVGIELGEESSDVGGYSGDDSGSESSQRPLKKMRISFSEVVVEETQGKDLILANRSNFVRMQEDMRYDGDRSDNDGF